MARGATTRSGHGSIPAMRATAVLMATMSVMPGSPRNLNEATQPQANPAMATPAPDPKVDSSRCFWPVPRISCTTMTAPNPTAMNMGRPVKEVGPAGEARGQCRNGAGQGNDGAECLLGRNAQIVRPAVAKNDRQGNAGAHGIAKPQVVPRHQQGEGNDSNKTGCR